MQTGYSEKELIEKDERYVIHGWGYSPIVLVEGKGAIVKDINGREYIDAISQMAGPTSIGASHPKVVEAVKKQVEKISLTFSGSINIPRVELSEKLAKITPPKLNKFFFACGGSEAVETALEGAMKITGKNEVISLYNAYHGGTLATLSLGQPCHREGFPTIPGFRQIPSPYCYRCSYGKEYPNCNFECARALEDIIRYGTYNNVAAFIAEPMLGNGGHIIPPDKEYFKIVREICDKYDVLLITDEIQTGFGRTGKMWACEHYDFQPDIMVIGKAMGGGLPISATVFREDILPPDFGKRAWHTFTFSGAPIVCAAASAAIDVVIEEKLPERAAKMGDFMMERLKLMQEKHPLIGDVRGKGLFIGVELVKDKKTKERAVDEATKVLQGSQRRGVLFGISSLVNVGNVIKIKPPLNITEDMATKILDVFEKAVSEVEKKSV
jgi:4-aminobutyrate aminotransferase/(S)-3-amino-2-methylpropionate transaminase